MTILKIGVCSLSIGDEYKRITRHSRLNKIEYCKKYNYTFIEDDTCYDSSKTIPWSKINLILKYLNDFDYIIWIDSDIFIMNDSISLENYIYDYQKEYDIMIGSDWKMPNTGMMFIKSSNFSKIFLKDVYNHTDYNPDDNTVPHGRYGNHEQGAFINLLDKNHLDCKSKILVTYPTLMNCYWYNYYKGNFILHWAAVRDKLLEDVMERFCPNRKDNDTDETYNARMKWLEGPFREEFDSKL